MVPRSRSKCNIALEAAIAIGKICSDQEAALLVRGMILNTVPRQSSISDGLRAEIRASICLLSEIQRIKLVEEITPFLRSDDGAYTRWNAIVVLGLFGRLASPAVPDLIRAHIGGRLGNIPWEIAKVLPLIGSDNIVPELIKALPPIPKNESDIPYSRLDRDSQELLDFFAAMGPAAEGAVYHLTTFLGASSKAAEALAKIGPGAIPAVIDVVKQTAETNTQVLSQTAKVFSKIGGPASQRLIDELESSTGQPRRAIWKVLSYLKPPALSIEMVPVLIRLMIEGCGRERCNHVPGFCDSSNATGVLRNIGADAVPFICESFAADVNHEYRAHSILRSDAVVPELEKGLSNKNVRVQAHCAAALLKVKPDSNKALEKLNAFLQSKECQTRRAAVDALRQGRSGSTALLPALMKAWCDPDSAVRRRAAPLLPHEVAAGLTRSVVAVTPKI